MKPEYLIVAIATLVYLVVDIYPSIRSFKAFVATPSFYILWLLFSVINVLAWAALTIAAGRKFETLLGDARLAALLIVILSTLSTLSVLQSFTIKIADYKFVDVGALLENFRKRVLSDMGDLVAKFTHSSENAMGDRLWARFQNDLPRLKNEYAQAMSFGGRALPQVGQELNDLQAACTANNLDFARQLALRIVKADFDRAKQLTR